MCGIVGMVAPEGAAASEGSVRAMMHAIRHRGPDGSGLRVDGPCGLGHLRLSIIDLSPAAAQPMSNEDGRLWLIFNGEIYNYVELAADLRARGHVFRSRTDSEVILHAYEEWGENCLDRFDGMWGFALWDRAERTLFCARDRAGIKPFYHATTPSGFYFGSEIKALLALPDVPRRLDARTLCLFLQYHLKDFDERTCFEGILQLPPGHCLTHRLGASRVRRYWAPPEEGNGRPTPETGGWAEAFRGQLEESVRLHLRSDVPVGACLSGGLDSSALTYEAARQLKTPLRTFSIVYPGTVYDESRYVRSVQSSVANLEPHTHTPDGRDVFEVLRRTVRAFDEPTWGPAVYSWWHLMRLIGSTGTKVVLGGQGCDELLAGYPAHYPTFLRELAVSGRLLQFRREARRQAALTGAGMAGLMRHLAVPLWPPAARRLARRVARARTYDAGFLNPEFVRQAGTPDNRRLRRGFLSLREHLRSDFTATRLPELLHAEDRFSMAFGIESRVPFLRTALVEFAGRLPNSERLRDGRTKVVLRDAMRGRLPDDVVDRPDKMGFPTPGERWLVDQAFDEVSAVLDASALREQGVFDARVVGERWRRLVSGEQAFDGLWRVLSTAIWAAEVLGGAGAAVAV